jgi:hypothetical protein
MVEWNFELRAMSGRQRKNGGIRKMDIAIDFDGTIVDHEYPKIGKANPGAIQWLKMFQDLDANLILLTMRDGQLLTEAVEYCKQHGIIFWGVNENPEQPWSKSRKVYANVYIDDANASCPLIAGEHRLMVDWSVVGPWVETKIIRGL